MFRPIAVLTSLFAAVLVMAASVLPARAGDLADARATLAKSVQVVEKVRSDQNFADWFDDKLARARAVMVVPSFYKGAFFIGGAYGNGLLVVRDDGGMFSPPAFIRMIGGSLGFQIGGQEGQLLFLIMTQKGLDAILQDQFKLGANVGVSLGTFGANMEAATTSNMDKDILVFGHARGAFGGGALEGAGIEPRPEWNRAVYGASATPKAILFDRRWAWQEAEALYSALRTTPVQPLPGPAATPSGAFGGTGVVSSPVPSAADAQPSGMGSPPPAQAMPVERAPMTSPVIESQPLEALPAQPAPASEAAPVQAPSESGTQPAPAAGPAPILLVPAQRQNLQ